MAESSVTDYKEEKKICTLFLMAFWFNWVSVPPINTNQQAAY